MKSLSKLKQWYTVAQAAEAISRCTGDTISEDDVVEGISTGEIPAWWNLHGRYAQTVYPACHYPLTPAQKASTMAPPECPGDEQIHFMLRDHETLASFLGAPVVVLTERHRLVVMPRLDTLVVPGEAQAEVVLLNGMLVRENDGESLLRIVKRRPGAPSDSAHALHFQPETEHPRLAELLIRSDDLQALIDEASSQLEQQVAGTSVRVPPGSEGANGSESLRKRRKVWTTEEKLQLLAESKLPSATHQLLAAKHGCSRQHISKLCKEAEELEKKPANVSWMRN